MIKPGIPQRKPQNINITKTAMTLMEKDFPIKIGSNMAPKTTCTPVIDSIKKNRVLVGSNSTKAKIERSITEIKEPTIWTKLIANANKPQKIGKLTSKKRHIRPVKIPVSKLTKNFTLINFMRSFSIFINALIEVCFCLRIVLLRSLCTLMDSASQSTTKKKVISIEVMKFLKNPKVDPIFSF